jgi:hypothetical protein
MLEKVYGKAAMKKMQVQEWHKCLCDGCASVMMIHTVGNLQVQQMTKTSCM